MVSKWIHPFKSVTEYGYMPAGTPEGATSAVLNVVSG